MNRFDHTLQDKGICLSRKNPGILQINLGKLCNLTCSHCHVEAGPTKLKENMNLETANACVQLMDLPGVHTLDLTGGAPEMNPHFKLLVTEGRKRGLRVIDRCNLTVLFEEDCLDLADFLAKHQVEVVASLPCYSSENVDKQRGRGVFDASIEGLLQLNRLGYGKEGSGLILNLVYNPVGPHLPPSQEKLQEEYQKKLYQDFKIVFNELYTITNMAITRYAKYLESTNQYESYVKLLIESFNPSTVEGLMCRETLSVGWDGRIYDCDFNLALGWSVQSKGRDLSIFNLPLEEWAGIPILTGEHCFGCTAGAGSSCQGALEEEVA